MSLAHDGTNTHFDGSRTSMPVDTNKGTVLPIADQSQRLAIPAMSYDCARQERTTTAVSSADLDVADPATLANRSTDAMIFDQEVAEGQHQLLTTHRRRLSILLCQQARLGEHTPSYIAI